MKKNDYASLSNDLGLKAVFNIRDAASYLTICDRKLRELIAQREIRTCRIGRRIVIRRVDLDNYLEDQCV